MQPSPSAFLQWLEPLGTSDNTRRVKTHTCTGKKKKQHHIIWSFGANQSDSNSTSWKMMENIYRRDWHQKIILVTVGVCKNHLVFILWLFALDIFTNVVTGCSEMSHNDVKKTLWHHRWTVETVILVENSTTSSESSCQGCVNRSALRWKAELKMLTNPSLLSFPPPAQ